MLIAYLIVFILPLIAIMLVAKAVEDQASFAARDAIVLNVAILCVAVATLAVIEFVLL